MITLTLLTLLYFLPTVIASERGHGTRGVFILNFLFGWTVIGWFALLLWALVSRPSWRYVAVPVYRPYYGHPYGGWRRY
jgi:purine-cytosine permease-like protein